MYARLVTLAEEVALDVASIDEELSKIAPELQKAWDGANADKKKAILVSRFADGMSQDTVKMLDRTHFTAHFAVTRSRITLSSKRNLGAELKRIERGVRQMKEMLEKVALMMEKD